LRRVLLTVAALLLAAPAWAKTWVVPGTDTFAAALAATAGDVVLLSAGSYGSLAPTGTGNAAQPVVWVGSGSCTVTGIVPKSYHRFYGITSSSGVDMPANGKKVMFNGCTITGSLNFKDADSSSVRSCTITGSSLTVNAGDGNMAQSDTVESCSFTGLSAASGFAIRFGITDAGLGYVDGFVRRFNTFAISQTGSAAYTPAKHFKTSNLLSYANKFTITSTASGVGVNEGDFGMVFRDSSYSLTMRRDTLFFDNEGASFSTNGLLTSSGMGGAYSSSLTGWAIDSCYFRVFNGTPVHLQAQVPGMRFRYNVVRSRLGRAISLASGFLAASNDPYIHHNTFMGSQAVHFGDQANTGGRFSNNILWGTSTATCAEDQAVGGCSNATPVSLSDSNFVYSTTADSTRSFYYTGGCLAPRVGAWAARPNDTHSYFASPAFTDTTWASLNARPTSSSLAFSSNLWTLGYAGAFDAAAAESPAPSGGCTCPPDIYFVKEDD